MIEAQCGFRKGRGTIDQIWVARQVAERAAEYCTPVLMCFVDLTKVYDSVDHNACLGGCSEVIWGAPSACGHHPGTLLGDLVSGPNSRRHVRGL